MKQEIKYTCSYCGKSSKVKSKIEKCENECKNKRDSYRSKSDEASDLRNQAESISHFAYLIQQFIIKHTGVYCKCEFKSWGTCIGGLSNTHSAPIGKKSNFSRVSSIPTSYIGWCGDFNIHMKDYSSEVSDIKGMIRGLNTGTGGARDHGLGWDCKLWADDFPKFGHKMYEYLEADGARKSYEAECDHIEYQYQKDLQSYVDACDDVIEAREALKIANQNVSNAISEAKEASPIKPMDNESKKVTDSDVGKIIDEIKG